MENSNESRVLKNLLKHLDNLIDVILPMLSKAKHLNRPDIVEFLEGKLHLMAVKKEEAATPQEIVHFLTNQAETLIAFVEAEIDNESLISKSDMDYLRSVSELLLQQETD